MITFCDMLSMSQRERLLKLLRSTPVVRSREISAKGIDRKTVQRMVDAGEIRRISRGLYNLADVDTQRHQTLVEAQKSIESGVICLLSALSFHEIGKQMPRDVWMAVARGSRTVRAGSVPVRVVAFSGSAFSEGVEEHDLSGAKVRVYSAAKTVADCFKYRNKLGTDVAVEALRDVVQSGAASPDELLRYADMCRVRKVMTPYLESMIL